MFKGDRMRDALAAARREPRPTQTRSRRSLDKIVEAARALIAEKGHEGVTVPELVARAGCSVGCFYGHFDGKDGVLRYTDQILFREASAAWLRDVSETYMEQAPAREVICDLIRGTVICTRRDEAFLRTLTVYWHTREPDPAIRAAAADHYQLVYYTYTARLIWPGRGEITHPNPERAIRFIIEVLDYTITERILFGGTRQSSLALSDDELVEELTDMCSAYLGVRSKSPSDT